MPKVSLFIYTKNTDLHAMSAFETVKSVLKYPYLMGLKRYRQITLTLDTVNYDDAVKLVAEFNRNSFQLLNPNKEAFYISHLVKPDLSRCTSVFVGSITSADLDAEAQLLKRVVEPAFSGRLKDISLSIVWEFLVDAHQLNDDALKAELRQRIVDTTSYECGLLVNPIYETFNWQDFSAVYADGVVTV